MNNQSIEEGNKAISLFMNDRRTADLIKDMDYDKTQGKDFHLNEEATLRQFKYHTSWDWLMPVVEKIDKLFDEESDNWMNKILDEDFPRITDLKITTPREYVWDAVIQFIKWYNQNNKNGK